MFESALLLREGTAFAEVLSRLSDLLPTDEDFARSLHGDRHAKPLLEVLRRSEIQRSRLPVADGFLHLVRPRHGSEWEFFTGDDFAAVGSTLGNTFLAGTKRRPHGSSTPSGFQNALLPQAVPKEHIDFSLNWAAEHVAERTAQIASNLMDVWRDGGA